MKTDELEDQLRVEKGLKLRAKNLQAYCLVYKQQDVNNSSVGLIHWFAHLPSGYSWAILRKFPLHGNIEITSTTHYFV